VGFLTCFCLFRVKLVILTVGRPLPVYPFPTDVLLAPIGGEQVAIKRTRGAADVPGDVVLIKRRPAS